MFFFTGYQLFNLRIHGMMKALQKFSIGSFILVNIISGCNENPQNNSSQQTNSQKFEANYFVDTTIFQIPCHVSDSIQKRYSADMTYLTKDIEKSVRILQNLISSFKIDDESRSQQISGNQQRNSYTLQIQTALFIEFERKMDSTFGKAIHKQIYKQNWNYPESVAAFNQEVDLYKVTIKEANHSQTASDRIQWNQAIRDKTIFLRNAQHQLKDYCENKSRLTITIVMDLDKTDEHYVAPLKPKLRY